MEKSAKKDKSKRSTTENTMSNASQLICKEEECIGKMTFTQNEDAADHESEAFENKKSETRSSMRFGDKDSCSNEECIGKT